MAASSSGIERSHITSFQDWIDTRSTWNRIVDLGVSLFNQTIYSANTFYYRYHPTALPSFSQDWKEESQGLIVLVHGLRNDPACWHAQLQLLQNQPAIDIYAPVVHQRGLCSLADAEAPLIEKFKEYTEKHPGKPICLLGTSNGGRLVAKLEISLRKEAPSTPVKVSSVAGVILGSSRIAFVDAIWPLHYFYPKPVREELRYRSDTAMQLLEELKAPLPDECAIRSYEFYATTEDLTIPNLDSSLLDLGEKKPLFILVHEESHSSIVSSVAEDQIASCLQWIRQPDAL